MEEWDFVEYDFFMRRDYDHGRGFIAYYPRISFMDRCHKYREQHRDIEDRRRFLDISQKEIEGKYT